MFIEVDENPNCETLDMMVFRDLEEARPVVSLKIEREGQMIQADVTGVDEGGKFIQAFAQKVLDSAAGHSYIIYGGEWGIRLRPHEGASDWDLENEEQWGTTHILYSNPDELVFI